MKNKIVIGGIYRHFKGDSYKVLYIAKDSETQRQLVVYQALNDSNDIWVRDYDMFASMVDKNKYPDVKQDYRFELIENGDN